MSILDQVIIEVPAFSGSLRVDRAWWEAQGAEVQEFVRAHAEDWVREGLQATVGDESKNHCERAYAYWTLHRLPGTPEWPLPAVAAGE